MPKVRVRGTPGKQLFVNNLFNRGMNYSSSELPAGFTKVISNFDITPNGDSAIPRKPYTQIVPEDRTRLGLFTYPIKFSQRIDEVHYITFNNLISPEEYIKNLGLDVLRPIGAGAFTIRHRNMGEFHKIAGTEIKTAEWLGASTNESPEDYEDYVFPDIPMYPVAHPGSSNIVASFNLDDDPLLLYFIDGDTIAYDTDRYRILGIDAPEKGRPWAGLSTEFLRRIKNTVESGIPRHLILMRDPNMPETDKYGRKLVHAFLRRDTTLEGNLHYHLGSEIIRQGLARVAYITNPKMNYLNNLINVQQYAESNGLGIFGTSPDPTFDYVADGVSLDFRDDQTANEDPHPELFTIEVLKQVNDSADSYYHSTHDEYVEFQYVDYRDAIVFIGRVRLGDVLKYKGPMVLKCNGDLGGFTLEILYNGKYINLTEASGMGYNVFAGDAMFNFVSDFDAGTPTVQGIISRLKNTNNIITEATPGTPIELEAIIEVPENPDTPNPDGYLVYPSYFKEEINQNHTVSGDFNIVYEPSGASPEIIGTGKFDVSAVSLGGTSTNSLLSYQQFTLVSKVPKMPDTSPDLDAIILKPTVTYKDLVFEYSDLEITAGTGTVTKTISNCDISLKITVMAYVENRSVVDHNLTIKFTLKTEVIAKAITYSWGKRWVKMIDDATVVLADWSLIDHDNEERQTYEHTPQAKDDNILKYQMNRLGRIKIAHETYTDYMELNDLARVEQTIIINVKQTLRTLDATDVYKNVNLSKATRISYFNRQLILYGPWLGSNSLQFSGFEELWYYPFPYYNIPDFTHEILHVHRHKNMLVVFTKFNIVSLSLGILAPELRIQIMYEQLTTTPGEVRSILSVGNDVFFMSNNEGYILLPSEFIDDPSRIKVYPLTKPVSKMMVNPKEYLANRLDDHLKNISVSYFSYTEGTMVNIVGAYDILKSDDTQVEYNIVYRYDIVRRIWSIYDFVGYGRFHYHYIAEPHINHQFISTLGNDESLMVTETDLINLELTDHMTVPLELVNENYYTLWQGSQVITEFEPDMGSRMFNTPVSNLRLSSLRITAHAGGTNYSQEIPIGETGTSGIVTPNWWTAEVIGYDIRLSWGLATNVTVTKLEMLYIEAATTFDDVPMLSTSRQIDFYIDSGFIAVDILNDKRFKNLFFEMLNTSGAQVDMFINFFIDNKAFIRSINVTNIIDNGDEVVIEYEEAPNLTVASGTFLGSWQLDFSRFGQNQRLKLRFPIFGKGRMPSFQLKLRATDLFELINYSVMYKEKTIERG